MTTSEAVRPPPSCGLSARVGALSALLALGACAPAVSSVPLGVGPLALAEQEQAEGAAAQRRQPARRAAGARRAEAPAAPRLDPPKGEAAEAASEEAGSEEAGNEERAPARSGFEGLFAGADIAVFRLTGFPEREQRDDKAQIRIEAASSGVGITLINSEDGSDLCELSARVEGNTALIESAQPCFGDGGEGSLEAQLTSGRAVLEGDRLRLEAEGTLSVSLPDQELDGQLSYSFKGERQ